MMPLKKNHYFFEEFLAALDDLRLALELLKGADKLAGQANINDVNPITLDLIRNRIVEICSLSEEEYADAVLSGEFRYAAEEIAIATKALTSPSVLQLQ